MKRIGFALAACIVTTNATKGDIITCDHSNFTKRSASETTKARHRAESAAGSVRNDSLTYLAPAELALHRRHILNLEQAGRPGMILECGVAKGGSAITFAAAKRPQRCLHLFDTFSGIPPPGLRDGADVHTRYQYIQAGKERKDYYGARSRGTARESLPRQPARACHQTITDIFALLVSP